MIGAGAVVVKDIKETGIYKGVPAMFDKETCVRIGGGGKVKPHRGIAYYAACLMEVAA